MPLARQLLIAAVAVVVILGAGYGWGASGRSALRAIADESRQALDRAEARGAILEGRVSLYNNNFGDASRQFEEAKSPLLRMKQRYQDAGEPEAVAAADAALKEVEEAQRLAAKLDPAAHNSAARALEALKNARR
jgi:hypothetical protein